MYSYQMKGSQHQYLSPLEERVDKGSDGGTLRQDQQHCEQAERDQDWRHPPTLIAPEERKQLSCDPKPMASGLQKTHNEPLPPKISTVGDIKRVQFGCQKPLWRSILHYAPKISFKKPLIRPTARAAVRGPSE